MLIPKFAIGNFSRKFFLNSSMTHRFKHLYNFRVSNTGCQDFSIFLTNFDRVGGEINCGSYPAHNGVKNLNIKVIFALVANILAKNAWWLIDNH